MKQAASDDRKITIELQDADIRNVIRLIGDVAERDVVFGDDVHGKVTTKFVNTPWERALDHILQTHDLVVEDGRYLSARWPGDAYLLARRFREQLE